MKDDLKYLLEEVGDMTQEAFDNWKDPWNELERREFEVCFNIYTIIEDMMDER